MGVFRGRSVYVVVLTSYDIAHKGWPIFPRGGFAEIATRVGVTVVPTSSRRRGVIVGIARINQTNVYTEKLTVPGIILLPGTAVFLLLFCLFLGHPFHYFYFPLLCQGYGVMDSGMICAHSHHSMPTCAATHYRESCPFQRALFQAVKFPFRIMHFIHMGGSCEW